MSSSSLWSTARGGGGRHQGKAAAGTESRHWASPGSTRSSPPGAWPYSSCSNQVLLRDPLRTPVANAPSLTAPTQSPEALGGRASAQTPSLPFPSPGSLPPWPRSRCGEPGCIPGSPAPRGTWSGTDSGCHCCSLAERIPFRTPAPAAASWRAQDGPRCGFRGQQPRVRSPAWTQDASPPAPLTHPPPTAARGLPRPTPLRPCCHCSPFAAAPAQAPRPPQPGSARETQTRLLRPPAAVAPPGPSLTTCRKKHLPPPSSPAVKRLSRGCGRSFGGLRSSPRPEEPNRKEKEGRSRRAWRAGAGGRGGPGR